MVNDAAFAVQQEGKARIIDTAGADIGQDPIQRGKVSIKFTFSGAFAFAAIIIFSFFILSILQITAVGSAPPLDKGATARRHFTFITYFVQATSSNVKCIPTSSFLGRLAPSGFTRVSTSMVNPSSVTPVSVP